MHINLDDPPRELAPLAEERQLAFQRQRRILLVAEATEPRDASPSRVYALHWVRGDSIAAATTCTTPAGLLAAAYAAADGGDEGAVLRAAFRGALGSLRQPATRLRVVETRELRLARWEGGELW